MKSTFNDLDIPVHRIASIGFVPPPVPPSFLLSHITCMLLQIPRPLTGFHQIPGVLLLPGLLLLLFLFLLLVLII